MENQIKALEHEFAKFKVWWMEQYNTITHVLQLAIGVRNNKIKEQNTRINKLEAKNNNLTNLCYTFSSKIETLEKELDDVKNYSIANNRKLNENIVARDPIQKQLDEISGKYAQLDYAHNLERQLKNALAQVDLNSQTLEELK